MLDIMPPMDALVFVFLFNSPLASGCDYVTQTMQIVSRSHIAFGLALGDIISLPKWLASNDRWLIKRIGKAVVIRPISLLPGTRYLWVRLVTYLVWSVGIRMYVDSVYKNCKKYTWFFEPFYLPPVLRVFTHYQSIYDCVDYYPAFNAQAKLEHDVLMRTSSYVFANSDALAAMLKKVRFDVTTVPLGFAEPLFRGMRLRSVPENKQPFVVGYVGSISARLDFRLLTQLIEKLPNVQFLFVGLLERNVYGRADNIENDFARIRSHANVQWIPGVPKSQIPAMMNRIDVGLIPYRIDNAFNRYAFPMKVMEYFYCGKPVVATDIIALRNYIPKKLVLVVDSPSATVRAITEYQSHGWAYKMQLLQRAEALDNGWENKICNIYAVLSGKGSRFEK